MDEMVQISGQASAESLKIMNSNIWYEDALLNFNVIHLVRKFHNLYEIKLYRHVEVGGFETDAVLIAHTLGKGIERWVGFELKEGDFLKAYLQASIRRRYFDYFYIVINLTTLSIVEYLIAMGERPDFGIISAVDNIVVLKSKFKKRKKLEIEKKEEIPDAQVKLLEFMSDVGKEDIWVKK